MPRSSFTSSAGHPRRHRAKRNEVDQHDFFVATEKADNEPTDDVDDEQVNIPERLSCGGRIRTKR